MKKNGGLLLLALLLLAPAAGYLLLPGEDERIAMLLREGRHSEAKEALAQKLAGGDRSPQTLASLARATELSGDIRGAVALMNEFIELRPQDPTGFDALARLYQLANAPDQEIAAMAKLVAIEPNPARVARLAGLYRLNGRFDAEFAMLSQARQKGVRLTVSDLVRLGEYDAAKGDREGAVEPLLEADALLPPEEDRGRVQLFDALVAAGRYDEAVSRATRWLTAWRKPWIAARMAQSLPPRTPDREAIELSVAVIKIFPETSFYVARALAAQGRPAVAAGILARWAAEETAPTTAQIGGLVDVAGVVGDPAVLWRLLPTLLKKTEAPEAQAYFLEALAGKFGDAAVVPLLAVVPPEALRTRPLLSARLALATGDQRLARLWLDRVKLAKMTAAEQRAWLDLVAEASSPEAAFTMLQDRRRRGDLPPSMLPHLASFAGRLGYSGEQMLIWNEFSRL